MSYLRERARGSNLERVGRTKGRREGVDQRERGGRRKREGVNDVIML